MVGTDEIGVHVTLDVRFHAHAPKDAVDNATTVSFAHDILRSTLGGCEDKPFLTRLGVVFTHPDARTGWLAGQRLAVRLHGIKNLILAENDGSLDRDGAVRSTHGVHVLDAPHHGVILLPGNHEHTGAVLVIFAVMACPFPGPPGFPDDLTAEAPVVLRIAGVIVVLAVLAFEPVETVRGRSQTGNRSPFVQVVDDRLHGLVIGSKEADEEKEHVRILDHLGAWNSRRAGLDVTILVQTEEHGALETITLGQDPGESGAGFFSSVLVIAGDKHDVLPLAGARFTLVDQRVCQGREAKLQGA